MPVSLRKIREPSYCQRPDYTWRSESSVYILDLRREAKPGRFLITGSASFAFRTTFGLVSSNTARVCDSVTWACRRDGGSLFVSASSGSGTLSAVVSNVSKTSVGVSGGVPQEEDDTAGEAGSDLSACFWKKRDAIRVSFRFLRWNDRENTYVASASCAQYPHRS